MSGKDKTFFFPAIANYEELGSNPEGSVEPTMVKVTQLNPRIANQIQLNINGTQFGLVTYPNTPGEYYIANSANPAWPAIFVNKPNSIPGATLPNMQVVEEISSQPTLNMFVAKPNGQPAIEQKGDIIKQKRLEPRPPALAGPFSRQNLIDHFEFYNQLVCDSDPGPIPNKPQIKWSEVYARLLTHFLNGGVQGGNEIDVTDLWLWKSWISGWGASSRTIWIDNVDQNVWCGVFNFQSVLFDNEAISSADINPGTPGSTDPDDIIDDYLYGIKYGSGSGNIGASLSQGAVYAGQLANFEVTAYSVILPGGQWINVPSAVAEGDPVAIAQVLLHVKGFSASSISSAKGISVGKFKYVTVAGLEGVERPGASVGRVHAVNLGLTSTSSPSEVKKVLFDALKSRKAQFRTDADQAVFFGSKYGDADWNSNLAHKYVQDSLYTKKTINYTDGGKWLMDQIAWLEDHKVAVSPRTKDRLWEQASKYFAKQASGKVTSFIGGEKLSSVYVQFEKPELIENGAVTEVLVVIPQISQ